MWSHTVPWMYGVYSMACKICLWMCGVSSDTREPLVSVGATCDPHNRRNNPSPTSIILSTGLSSTLPEDEKSEDEDVLEAIGVSVPLNRCLRSPKGWCAADSIYRSMLVRLQMHIVECFCHLHTPQQQRIWEDQGFRVGPGYVQSDEETGAALQDPNGALVSALLLLRCCMPNQSPGVHFEAVLCATCLMVALKTISVQGGMSDGTLCDANKEPIGPLTNAVIEYLCQRRGVPSASLQQVINMEASLLSTEAPVLSIVHDNPVAYVEDELYRLYKNCTVKNNEEFIVLRGVTTFFLLSAMHNTAVDVLEDMGTWATTKEMGNGLVSLALACFAAASERRASHEYPPTVARVARVFLREGRSRHSTFFKGGARHGQGVGDHIGTPSICDLLSAACLKRAAIVLLEAKQ